MKPKMKSGSAFYRELRSSPCYFFDLVKDPPQEHFKEPALSFISCDLRDCVIHVGKDQHHYLLSIIITILGKRAHILIIGNWVQNGPSYTLRKIICARR